MKVLHLNGGDVGGAKTHILSLVKELKNHIDVKLVSFRPGLLADDARAMGIQVEVVKTGNVFSDLKRVIQIIKTEGYQIVHSHGPKANMFAVILKRFVNLPTVTTIHSDFRLDYLQSVYKKYSYGLINSIALRHIQYHVCVSGSLKNLLVSKGFNPSRIFLLPNGINFSNDLPEFSRTAFSEKFNLALKDEDIVVGILARLTPVKDINTFLLAAKCVLEKYPSIKFLIGGDGEERQALEQKAVSLGIEKNIFFLGFVSNVYEFMNSLDISLLTSISEGLPYSVLEGARLKKATISSAVGGIPDLIESGTNGYLFTAGDYNSLAEYIFKLAENSSLRNQFGEKLYEKASDLFSLDAMCRTQLEIYNKILNKEYTIM